MSACALAVSSWVSLLAGRVRTCLIAALALYLARPVKRCSQSAAADTESADPEALSAMLRYGDVVLTEGNTRMAALVRRITGSSWSHVSMYVGPLEEGPDPRCIVEADVAAGVRAVPLSELKGLRLRVLRPTCLRDIDRRRLADWVVSRIGDEYDVAHAWALARRLLGLPSARRLPPAAGSLAQGATRFICSSLLAQAFVLVGYPIAAVQLGDRDSRAADHRFVTPRDFESAPVFEVIHVGPADRRR
jgi:Permuted papain-like amidase enzyme, YaeF/YiiX, C92 family